MLKPMICCTLLSNGKLDNHTRTAVPGSICHLVNLSHDSITLPGIVAININNI